MKKVALLATSFLFIACGQPIQSPTQAHHNIVPQTIHGTPSKLGDRPYQAAILADGNFLCDGVIIAKNWILTSGNCLSARTQRSELIVRVGSLNRNKGGQAVKVKNMKFKFLDFGSDKIRITLINLASDLELNKNVAITALPTKEVEAKHAAPGQSLIVSGWGHYNRKNRRASKFLREAPLEIMTNEACQECGLGINIEDNLICGQHKSKDPEVSSNQSRPLVKKVNGQFYVFGIEIKSRTNAIVFIRVANLIPWIDGIAGIPPKDIIKNTYEKFIKTNKSKFEPNEQGFKYYGGILKAELLLSDDDHSNAYHDFDLFLQKKDRGTWVTVMSGTKEGNIEEKAPELLQYLASAGTYRWEVYSYKGNGKYKLVTTRK